MIFDYEKSNVSLNNLISGDLQSKHLHLTSVNLLIK